MTQADKAAEAEAMREERKERSKAVVSASARQLNKPIYEGVCSKSKRYSVLLGMSAGSEKFGQQNLEPVEASFVKHASEPITKPRRNLNNAYKGSSRRRNSVILGLSKNSTNARAKLNRNVASMGRPANRWTCDGPQRGTSKLPRLPPSEQQVEVTQKKSGVFVKRQKLSPMQQLSPKVGRQPTMP
jgi:hypothetical protein